jgi:hypothetical protein
MAVAGVVLAWVIFYGAGQALIESSDHLEQSIWQSR